MYYLAYKTCCLVNSRDLQLLLLLLFFFTCFRCSCLQLLLSCFWFVCWQHCQKSCGFILGNFGGVWICRQKQ